MIVTLDTFEISNGVDRTLRVLGNDTFTLTQQTDEELLLRDGWPTFFPDRASRLIPLSYEVTFPACVSLAAALQQARQIPVLCPKGGTLTEEWGATLITYEAAKVDSITARRLGVTNVFTFNLSAVNPEASVALSPLAKLSMSYIANLPLIVSLTGGGSTSLNGQVTADVAVGLTAFITPTIGGLVVPKHFRLIAASTAENTDPAAGLLVVRPLDYDSGDPKVWVEC